MSAKTVPVEHSEVQQPSFGFWLRSYAMVVKEFIQLRRDRVSFGMIVMIPVMQLLLFGYAINTTPRNLPSAVLLQEDSDLARSILKALENTSYFHFTREVHDVAEFGAVLARRCRADRARARPVRRRSAVAAVRDKGARALQSGGLLTPEHRARPGRHHPDHDHADLHRAVGDPRDRTRHHGKPAVDADQADRGDVRQDRALRAGRFHPGGADHRHRRLAVRGADPRQRIDAGAAVDLVHYHQPFDRLYVLDHRAE